MIPKIEWNYQTLSTTFVSGSDAATANSASLKVGMKITSPTLGELEIVEILSTTQIRIDKQSTADITEDCYYRKQYEFKYPPQKDDTERIKVKKHERTSLAGIRQVSVDYIEMMLRLEFDFLTTSELESLKNFYLEWASFGKEFKYYADKDIQDYVLYEARTLGLTTTKTTPVLYKVKFYWRRVANVL